VTKKNTITLTIESGKQKGEAVSLGEGTCKIIGRALDNPQETLYQEKDLILDFIESEIHKINSFLASFWSARDKKQATQPTPKNSKSLQNPFKRTQDLVLQDIQVSRIHAMIFNAGGECGIVDLMSKNGTYLGEKRVDMVPLNDGSTLKIGNTQIKIQK
jgi:hypothetical protein